MLLHVHECFQNSYFPQKAHVDFGNRAPFVGESLSLTVGALVDVEFTRVACAMNAVNVEPEYETSICCCGSTVIKSGPVCKTLHDKLAVTRLGLRTAGSVTSHRDETVLQFCE